MSVVGQPIGNSIWYNANDLIGRFIDADNLPNCLGISMKSLSPETFPKPHHALATWFVFVRRRDPSEHGSNPQEIEPPRLDHAHEPSLDFCRVMNSPAVL